MRFRLGLLVVAACLVTPTFSDAQDFGVMESPETIDRDTFKLRFNPVVIFGKDGADDQVGVSILAGYGFTDAFDVEGGVALYDGVRFFGANAEAWLVRRPGLDFSVIGGVHVARGDKTLDTTGLDLTFLAGREVRPNIELYGALDFAFDFVDETFINETFTPVHIVPGVEIALSPDLDFLAEVGISITDDGRHYFSGGLAYYFR